MYQGSSKMEIILHITDLHFGYEGNNVNAKAKRQNCLDSLLNEISNLDSSWKPSIICITGDVVWRGAASDFVEAKSWLDKLLENCDLDYSKVICCPGNHEVDRSKAKKIPRPSTASEADDSLEYPIASHFLEPFSEYISFCEEARIPALELGGMDSRLVGTCTINKIRFVVLNTAWFSKDNEDKDKLWLGLPHLELMQSNQKISILEKTPNAPITIALMHHPTDWLHPDEQAAFSNRTNTRDYLAARCHILLTGHTHAEVRDPDQIARGTHHFSGGATYAASNYFNNFRLIRIEDECVVYRSFEYDPRSPKDEWKSSSVKALAINVGLQADISKKKLKN
jgi:predicted MPP superfamily phosphohydrolase